MPDVAVLGVEHAAQRRGGHGGEIARRGRLRQRLGELDQLALVCGVALDLVEEHRVGEEAGDVLRDVGEKVDLDAPVALGVVVELDEADHLAADDDRHAQGARVAPLVVQRPLLGGEALVPERTEDERLAGGEGLPRWTGYLLRSMIAAAVVLVFAGPVQAHQGDETGFLGTPDVDVVGVRRGHDAFRDGLDERPQVRGAGHLLREADELAHRAPALVEVGARRRDVDGVGDEPRDGPRERQMRGEVEVERVAHFEGADEGAAGEEGRPEQRVAAALTQRGRLPRRRGAAANGDGRLAPGILRAAPVGEREAHPRPRRVLSAGVGADEDLEVVAGDGDDLAARGPRELDQCGGGATRKGVRIVGEGGDEIVERAVPRRRRDGGGGKDAGLGSGAKAVVSPVATGGPGSWIAGASSTSGASARISSSR